MSPDPTFMCHHCLCGKDRKLHSGHTCLYTSPIVLPCGPADSGPGLHVQQHFGDCARPLIEGSSQPGFADHCNMPKLVLQQLKRNCSLGCHSNKVLHTAQRVLHTVQSIAECTLFCRPNTSAVVYEPFGHVCRVVGAQISSTFNSAEAMLRVH